MNCTERGFGPMSNEMFSSVRDHIFEFGTILRNIVLNMYCSNILYFILNTFKNGFPPSPHLPPVTRVVGVLHGTRKWRLPTISRVRRGGGGNKKNMSLHTRTVNLNGRRRHAGRYDGILFTCGR